MDVIRNFFARALLLFIIVTAPLFVSAQIITTVAGGGAQAGTDGIGDGLPATDASLAFFATVAIDDSGNIFIADPNRQRIRKVEHTTGIITTIAGTGIAGYNGDGMPATSTQFYTPSIVVLDSGNIYIGDAGNYRIRRVDGITSIVTNYAGNGILGYTGDNCLADTTEISSPFPAWDRFGNMYIGDNYRIRKVNPSGIITTIAGTGVLGYGGNGGPATAAVLNYVAGICTDAAGNIYFTDNNTYTVRKINVSTGIITKVAGTDSVGTPYLGDGIPATVSHINPFGIAVDDTGNLYIADYGNSRIEKVDTFGIIHTLTGDGSYSFSGDGGPATAATIDRPEGVSLDKCGNVYIADFANKRVREIIFDSTCGSNSDTTHTDTTNVVQNIKARNFSIYPNPATTAITITGSSVKSVQVINMLGQVVYNKIFNVNKTTIDISALPNGVYFVKVNDASGRTYVEKVVKE